MTSRAPHALELYNSTIRPCFATKAARRRALGVTTNALKPWEDGTLVSPNEETLERLRLIAAMCHQLAALFPEKRTIGEYLESPVLAGITTTRLDLVLSSHDPELALKLARQEARAVARAIGASVPVEMLTDDAWRPVIDSMPPANRALFDELQARSLDIKNTAVL